MAATPSGVGRSAAIEIGGEAQIGVDGHGTLRPPGRARRVEPEADTSASGSTRRARPGGRRVPCPSTPICASPPISMAAERPTPDGVAAILHEHPVTVFYAVPTFYAAFLAHSDAQKNDSAQKSGEAQKKPG